MVSIFQRDGENSNDISRAAPRKVDEFDENDESYKNDTVSDLNSSPQRVGENSKFIGDVQRSPLESVDFDEHGGYGENGEFGENLQKI